MSDDTTTTVKELKDYVMNFSRERAWDRFHTAKNLSMAIVIESSELLQSFEWMSDKEGAELPGNLEKKEKISKELPDVFSKVLEFLEKYDVPIESALYKNYDEKTTVDELRNGSKRYKKQEHEVRYDPRNLAMEISRAGGKVMEHFTSLSDEECEHLMKLQDKKSEILYDLSDALFFILKFSDVCDIDITTAFYDKMEENAKKYPVEKAKGSNRKYTELK